MRYNILRLTVDSVRARLVEGCISRGFYGVVRSSSRYGGLREKRFLLPIWKKRGFSAKTPPKFSRGAADQGYGKVKWGHR
jgi:hypothetical protein